MVSDVSLEMQSDSKNYVGLQDDEITEPVHTTSSNRRLGKCVRHFKGEILCCGYWGR